MGALRRIAVVGRSSRIHDLAQEVTQEVLLADDLPEACDIVETVSPDLTVSDETVSPSDIRGSRERTQAKIASQVNKDTAGDNEY